MPQRACGLQELKSSCQAYASLLAEPFHPPVDPFLNNWMSLLSFRFLTFKMKKTIDLTIKKQSELNKTWHVRC